VEAAHIGSWFVSLDMVGPIVGQAEPADPPLIGSAGSKVTRIVIAPI
jgi:hypothetical protein